MIGNHVDKLLTIVTTKQKATDPASWQGDSTTYINELHKELNEVAQEIGINRQCYLEDECGDLLWDYLNLLKSLEQEGEINISRVFQRAQEKYEERWQALQSGISWQAIKEIQKERLAQEQANINQPS